MSPTTLLRRPLAGLAAPALAAVLLGAAPAGGGGDGDDPPSGTFAMRCGRIHVGDGTVVDGAWLVVRDGKVSEIRAGKPADLPAVDASDKVVIPGIVAADTNLAGERDVRYNITPDFVALSGFDFTERHRAVLAGGVTTAYLSPGRRKFVSGQGSVVKLAGDDLIDRVLREHAALRVALGEAGVDRDMIFEPVPDPSADQPLLPARRQVPTSIISQVPTLRRLIRDAVAGGIAGTGADEDRYTTEAFVAVRDRRLPLRVAARDAADVDRALRFAASLGLELVLEDPYEIGAVAERAAAAGAAAVFRVPVRPGTSNPGGDRPPGEATVSRPENPAAAAAAGMTFAITPADDEDLEDYLMVAGIAIRHGLDADRALAAITLDAARLLGVAGRVGSLEPGKDADFAVLSGEPFAIGTLVESTYVDGVPVYRRKTRGELLAIRADRIVTGDGQVLRNGVLIAENGRIKALGEELPVPYGARVIEAGGTMVPGFIDAHCHVGLVGEARGIPGGAPDHRIAEVVDPQDPALREVLRAGVTTVLVSGSDGGRVAGRVTALKTGATSRESMVVSAIAGQRFAHDEIGPDALKPLVAEIDKGRKYIAAFEKYRKALAEFEAGNRKERPVFEEVETVDAAVDPVSGVWQVALDIGIPVTLEGRMSLELQGTRVTGELVMSARGRELPPLEIERGEFRDGTLEIDLRGGFGGNTSIEATVADDSLNGTVQAGNRSGTITGTRVEKPDAAGGTGSGGDLKEPRIDHKLEPIKAILEKRAPAVVRTSRAPAIRDVVRWFGEQELPLVLTEVEDLLDDPDLLGDSRVSVLLGPEVVVDGDDGRRVNVAAALAERGHAIALSTGDVAGTRYLPLHAAYAVRYGLDPVTALQAITIQPAKMFRIDDRVGSLARGKDADLVVFSGDPFEMTSRVRLVVCNGRVVHDARGDEEQR